VPLRFGTKFYVVERAISLGTMRDRRDFPHVADEAGGSMPAGDATCGPIGVREDTKTHNPDQLVRTAKAFAMPAAATGETAGTERGHVKSSSSYLLERRALCRIMMNTMIKMTRAIASATIAPVPTANIVSPPTLSRSSGRPFHPMGPGAVYPMFTPLPDRNENAPPPQRGHSWPPSLPPPLGCSPRVCRICWQG